LLAGEDLTVSVIASERVNIEGHVIESDRGGGTLRYGISPNGK
jgi:hypothetical protein